MSDAVQIALIAATLPALLSILSNVVTHLLSGRKLKEQDKKLDTIEKLSNSMLSHQVEKKEEVEKKLEQTKDAQLAATLAENAALREKVALMTNPKSE